MTLSAVVFGSLGTLTETSHLHHRAFNETFAAEGLGWHWDDSEYRQLLSIVGGAERIKQYAEGQPDGPALSPEAIADLQAKKTQRYVELIHSEPSTLRPGVKRLIEEATKAGVAVGLATGTSLANLTANLEATGQITLADFAAYTTRNSELAPKPAPDIHRSCMSKLGVAPSETVAIEDTTDGVGSAATAGAVVLATPGAYVSHQDFSQATASVSWLGDHDHETELLSGPSLLASVVDVSWLRSLTT